jgi:small redox-active disulfide protein 2
MKIEVLGTGCPKCKKTYNAIKEQLDKLGISAELVKVEDVNDIVSKGVMITPAVMVDGEIKVEGKVPSVNEITSWLK